MRIGYLSLPHFSIQAASLRHPELRGRPMLIGGTEDQLGRVYAASPDCLAIGVRIGMATREAREICPNAACLQANPDADAEILGRALDLLDRFAEVVEPSGIAGAWFVPALPFFDERRLGAALVDGLAASLGLEGRIGVGPGKFIARIAAERAVSGSAEIIPPGRAAAYLASLPVTHLPLSLRAIERLKLLGIATIADFAGLPVESLARRFGRESPFAQRLARGEDETLLIPRQRPELRTRRRTFEPAIEDRRMLLAAAQDLLTRLADPLVAEQRAFRRLGLEIGLEDGRIVERSAELRTPTNLPRHCQALLRGMIEALSIDGAIATLLIRLGAIAPAPPRQETLFEHDLFSRSRDERRDRLNDARVEIARRYRGRLRRVIPSDDPNSLFDDRRLLLLLDEPSSAFTAPLISPPVATAESAARPRLVRLIGQGERIYLIESGLPRDRITRLHARWEADDWWPDPTRRTYYRVRTQSGRIVTLARDHDQRRWLLIESFD